MQTIKLLHVKATPIWDLFTGEGWYNWTRVLVRGSEIKVLAGTPLTPEVQSQLVTELKTNAKPSKTG
jgi:hypothetical protein